MKKANGFLLLGALLLSAATGLLQACGTKESTAPQADASTAPPADAAVTPQADAAVTPPADASPADAPVVLKFTIVGSGS